MQLVDYHVDSGEEVEILAHEAGVNRSYMSKVERWATYVGLEIIGKLADVLEVSPQEFLEPLPKERSKRPKAGG